MLIKQMKVLATHNLPTIVEVRQLPSRSMRLPMSAVHTPAIRLIWILVGLRKETQWRKDYNLLSRHPLRFTKHLKTGLFFHVLYDINSKHGIDTFRGKHAECNIPNRID